MEKLYYLSHYLYLKKIPVLPKLIELMIRFFFHASIPYQADIGPGVSFGHRQGIMMGKRVKVGQRCKIRHQVTIAGGKGGGAVIGDDVQIGAGAKIIGAIRIGNRVRIGANAVVVKDVPDDATVVGIPARVVRIAGKKVVDAKEDISAAELV
ncbi:serine O-acetyltransferase [Azohydromonas caseinilytica]|uniref:Serine acetyltransferase n=1 Tax=Azohydromonas caseinilytica TaxID=2728836 RepID=A0A848FEM2_9BURK|nr:serine acetyltransferase [Azohydromonas caseinilytica]NML17516.1 serine acetyltransferase [Azohydromonas caseinilytica]